jgi:hypothetical protein
MYILQGQSNKIVDKVQLIATGKPFTSAVSTLIWRDSDGQYWNSSGSSWGGSPVYNTGATHKGQGVFSFLLSSSALTDLEGDIIRWVMTDNSNETIVTVTSQGGSAKILEGESLVRTMWTDERADLIDNLASFPTDIAVADAVWNEARSGHVTTGSFGEAIQQILGSPATVAAAVLNSLLSSYTTSGTLGRAIRDIFWSSYNRRKVDSVANTETLYRDDGVTSHQIFDLKNSAGNPSSQNVFEKVPR